VSIASQDFRDGAALGARILAERIIAAEAIIGHLQPNHIRHAATLIASEYGGEPISDARARETARVG